MTTETTWPMEVGRATFDDPCSDCGTRIPVGEVVLLTDDAACFYCFPCVTRYYEAMRAARG